MIHYDVENKIIKETLLSRLKTLNEPTDIDVLISEFDDVKYRIQASASEPSNVLLSMAVPQAGKEFMTSGGLPLGAIEEVQTTYFHLVEVLSTPENGYHLTLLLDLSKLPQQQEAQSAFISKLAALRSVIMGAPLRAILKPLAEGGVSGDSGILNAIVYRPGEVFFALPRAHSVTVIYPMRFTEEEDAVLASSFLQELADVRSSNSSSSSPSCFFSPTPPPELSDAPDGCEDAAVGQHAKDKKGSGAGFFSFVVLPEHLEGPRMEGAIWMLSTFYAFVSHQVKCTKGFMHSRMRKRVESLILNLDRAKLGAAPSTDKVSTPMRRMGGSPWTPRTPGSSRSFKF